MIGGVEDFVGKMDSVVHTLQVANSENPDKIETTMCTVFFPRLFEQMRELLKPAGNARFIEALMDAHSVELTGGQVGSFLRTQCGQYIIKMIKKGEAESFGKQ